MYKRTDYTNFNRTVSIVVAVFLLLVVTHFYYSGSANTNSNVIQSEIQSNQSANKLESSSEKSSKSDTTNVILETRGPNGERPVPFGVVGMNATDRKKIQSLQLKAAILMHTSSDFTNAVIAGAQKRFDELGVKVVYIGNANFDTTKERTDIEAALALKVDLIVTLVLDPKSGSLSLKKAVKQGVKIALLSNLPENFVHKRDYASLVTDDLFTMGKSIAEMMGEAFKGDANVAWLYHDAQYYVTNQRDMTVKTNLARLYPDIKIIAEKGISNPAESQKVMTELLAKNPQIQAVYAPWDAIADGVLKALRAAGRDDIKVFTMDLGKNVSLDLANKGNVEGIVVDLPFTIGESLAILGCLSVIGNETPPFVVVPSLKVNRTNLEQMWERAYHTKTPEEVVSALKK